MKTMLALLLMGYVIFRAVKQRRGGGEASGAGSYLRHAVLRGCLGALLGLMFAVSTIALMPASDRAIYKMDSSNPVLWALVLVVLGAGLGVRSVDKRALNAEKPADADGVEPSAPPHP